MLGEEIGRGETGQDESKHHQGDCPLATFPRSSCVPYRHTHHRDDISISLCAGAQDTDADKGRREYRLSKCNVLVLVLPEHWSEEKQRTRNESPHVGLVVRQREVADKSQ